MDCESKFLDTVSMADHRSVVLLSNHRTALVDTNRKFRITEVNNKFSSANRIRSAECDDMAEAHKV